MKKENKTTSYETQAFALTTALPKLAEKMLFKIYLKLRNYRMNSQQTALSGCRMNVYFLKN